MLPLPLGSRRAPSGGKAAALSRQLWGLYCSLQTEPPPGGALQSFLGLSDVLLQAGMSRVDGLA